MNTPQKISADGQAEMETLYRTGRFSLRQLAAKYGVNHQTILNRLRARGVPINPPHHWLRPLRRR